VSMTWRATCTGPCTVARCAAAATQTPAPPAPAQSPAPPGSALPAAAAAATPFTAPTPAATAAAAASTPFTASSILTSPERTTGVKSFLSRHMSQLRGEPASLESLLVGSNARHVQGYKPVHGGMFHPMTFKNKPTFENVILDILIEDILSQHISSNLGLSQKVI
jgi:hypothetical protein